jgi:hypothetical protein
MEILNDDGIALISHIDVKDISLGFTSVSRSPWPIDIPILLLRSGSASLSGFVSSSLWADGWMSCEGTCDRRDDRMLGETRSRSGMSGADFRTSTSERGGELFCGPWGRDLAGQTHFRHTETERMHAQLTIAGQADRERTNVEQEGVGPGDIERANLAQVDFE